MFKLHYKIDYKIHITFSTEYGCHHIYLVGWKWPCFQFFGTFRTSQQPNEV